MKNDAKYSFPQPFSFVDTVILSIIDERLKVLLVKRDPGISEPFAGWWALPGGFVDVDRDRTLEQCALRKLKEKTGVSGPYLEQVGSWGSADRDPRGWSVTHVYVALLSGAPALQPGGNADDAEWAAIGDSGVDRPLAFDHAELLSATLERVRSKTEYTSLPAQFLPETFSLSEIQRVYEIVLGRKLDKKAFRTRVLAVPLLEETAERKSTGRRPARLYRLARGKELVYFARTFTGNG
ncbi:MAG: NUDIX hydrolase [Methylobacteriaceae bacterium]|jgi:ADP-ribose pyrophosphatase YjhB (NUDIX family)|nr:NUDIX hydrolase [Methylobacteriaceae bacterium]